MIYHTKRPCVICGTEFEASRGDARFCSPNCRKTASRQRDQLEKTYERAKEAVRSLEAYIDTNHALKPEAIKLLTKLDLDLTVLLSNHVRQRHIYEPLKSRS